MAMCRLNVFLARCALCVVSSAAIVSTSVADQPQIHDTTIAQVNVNGGTDTENVGTTCVRVTAPVSGACPNGWIAVKNNNKLLIATALQAKAMGALIWFYYDNAGATQHCPGQTYTPCTVINISIN